MTANLATRPLTLLIAALGGEGGGVMTNWIVNAARRLNFPVQSTSVPGVAQRTGATTYYIEIWPEPYSTLGTLEPVLALNPAPGELDIVISTELLETGRCITNGFVTPDRTQLITSTQRVYTTLEKMARGDGRFDAANLLAAAKSQSRQHLLLDVAEAAKRVGAQENAVLLGVIAQFCQLPMSAEILEEEIRHEGKAVAANLRGFQAGMELVRLQSKTSSNKQPERLEQQAAVHGVNASWELVKEKFPTALQEILAHALPRLKDYQDEAYVQLYLDRLLPFRDLDLSVLQHVARHLAVRMSYEDVIRVAGLKIKRERMTRIRQEAGANAYEPVHIVEFFKPGIAEVCDILPNAVAKKVLALSERHVGLKKWHKAMHVDTSTVIGFLKVWILSRLKLIRRASYRYKIEQAAIELWLGDVLKATAFNISLAVEIAECARLIKGYGNTHRRGLQNFYAVRDRLIVPALANQDLSMSAAKNVADAREAALASIKG